MNLWLDCEFNGWNGSLISMAIVSSDGQEFYEVLRCDNPVEWVAENVMPFLGKPPIAQDEFTRKLQSFLRRFRDCVVIADWPDDIAYFCKALITAPGERITTPPITLRILTDLPDEAYEAEVRHNALSDARAMKNALCSAWTMA